MVERAFHWWDLFLVRPSLRVHTASTMDKVGSVTATTPILVLALSANELLSCEACGKSRLIVSCTMIQACFFPMNMDTLAAFFQAPRPPSPSAQTLTLAYTDHYLTFYLTFYSTIPLISLLSPRERKPVLLLLYRFSVCFLFRSPARARYRWHENRAVDDC